VQIRHNPLSGGYCGEVPPLPIPNREVKLTCADGTAMQCGRVGSRLLLSRASDFERFLRLFCFHAVLLSYRPAFFPQLLTAPFTFLPFYFFTFIYFSLKNDGESSLVIFMYKMLTDCGFSFKKSEKLRTKMFHSAKKVSKIPPPIHFFFLLLPPENANYHVNG
jgi:hypothetical protein